jgi:hypothetical protein
MLYGLVQFPRNTTNRLLYDAKDLVVSLLYQEAHKKSKEFLAFFLSFKIETHLSTSYKINLKNVK